MADDLPRFDVQLRLIRDTFRLDIEYCSSCRSLGVFGVSGSGKTTLLEAIAGLNDRLEGVVRFSGQVWLDSDRGECQSAEQRGVGYVPQDHRLYPHLSARENILFGSKRLEDSGQTVETVFTEVVSVLELGELLDRPVQRLSGGERQRVALGRALCSGPQLLLLDEPLSSLDAELRWKILPFLIRIRDRFEIPMIVVSHNPIELQALCDEVLTLHKGRAIRSGDPIDVFTDKRVFNLANESGFENLLFGKVVDRVGRVDTVALSESSESVSIKAPSADCDVGAEVIAKIAPNDILVAISEPKGLSARNQIPARITCIQKLDHRSIAQVEVSGRKDPLIVELTDDSIDELSLAAGVGVILVFKTTSISFVAAL